MITLKRHSLPLLLLFITGVLLATMTWHYAHCRLKETKLTGVQIPGIGMVVVGGEAPPTSEPATWDWSLIGQAAGAILTGLLGVWQLLRRKDVAGAIQAGGALIRDVVQGGGPMVPSEDRLATELSGLMGASTPNDLHRAFAKDLLTRYSITVKP